MRDIYPHGDYVTYVGFQTVRYATVYWLVDGERRYKTVCFDAQEVADAINNRTHLTQGLPFEIEYTKHHPCELGA